jgi:hypothetical protein
MLTKGVSCYQRYAKMCGRLDQGVSSQMPSVRRCPGTDAEKPTACACPRLVFQRGSMFPVMPGGNRAVFETDHLGLLSLTWRSSPVFLFLPMPQLSGKASTIRPTS